MQKLHLVTAVLATMSKFHALKKDFSAHQVTTSLRDEVESGDLTISDVEQTYGPNMVSNVVHSEVRDIVDELFKLKYIPDYVTRVTTDPITGRSYTLRKYQEEVTPAPSLATKSVAALVGLTTPAQAAPSNPAPVAAPSLAGPIAHKVYVYLQNRAPGLTTMKQIQSRLKGHSITCKELIGLVETKLGKTVINRSVHASKVLV